MTNFELKPAVDLPIPDLAHLLTRGFEGYFVPITITEAALLSMLRRDSIDLFASRILYKNDEPIGLGLIARRGWTSRLAAMGIVTSARNGGAGTFAMQKLIDDARARGEKQMLLEVIEQNTAGVKLYQKVGFNIVRRLVGYQLENPISESRDELQEIDIREYAKLVSTDGIQDLPWQLSAETVAQHTPPSRAFQLGDAFCVISNPDAVDVSIVSVLVKAGSRRAGQGRRLMRAVFSRFPEKTWHVPALYPEEMSPFFEALGFKRESISQWQMAATL